MSRGFSAYLLDCLVYLFIWYLSYKSIPNTVINHLIFLNISIKSNHSSVAYEAFKLLKEHKCIVCENALTIDKPNTITQDYQLFTAMKGYSNSDIFSNLKVCTDPYFKLVSYLEEKFPSLFQKYKVQPRVGESIFCYFVYELGVGKFLNLRCPEALYGLLRFYIMCKIYFTLRFKNRQFAKKKNASNINFEM